MLVLRTAQRPRTPSPYSGPGPCSWPWQCPLTQQVAAGHLPCAKPWKGQRWESEQGHLTPTRMAAVKQIERERSGRWRGCGELEASCTVDGNVKCCHRGKRYGSSSEKLNTEFLCEQQFHVLETERKVSKRFVGFKSLRLSRTSPVLRTESALPVAAGLGTDRRSRLRGAPNTPAAPRQCGPPVPSPRGRLSLTARPWPWPWPWPVRARAGRATHGGRGEPLRAGHRQPQLPVRLPVQLIRPQKARPCGGRWGPSTRRQSEKPSPGGSGALYKQPTNGPTPSISSRAREIWVQILAPPLTRSGSLGLLLNLANPACILSVEWGEMQTSRACCQGSVDDSGWHAITNICVRSGQGSGAPSQGPGLLGSNLGSAAYC